VLIHHREASTRYPLVGASAGYVGPR